MNEDLLAYPGGDLVADGIRDLEARVESLAVAAMVGLGLVEPAKLSEYFDSIVPMLFRHPSIDPTAFREAVGAFVRPYLQNQG